MVSEEKLKEEFDKIHAMLEASMQNRSESLKLISEGDEEAAKAHMFKVKANHALKAANDFRNKNMPHEAHRHMVDFESFIVLSSLMGELAKEKLDQAKKFIDTAIQFSKEAQEAFKKLYEEAFVDSK